MKEEKNKREKKNEELTGQRPGCDAFLHQEKKKKVMCVLAITHAYLSIYLYNIALTDRTNN